MRTVLLSLVLPCLLLLGAAPLGAEVTGPAPDVQAANAAGKAVFLVVTDGGQGLDEARRVAEAAASLAPATTVLHLDRQDPARAAAVDAFRLAAAPVPLVLVIARNGVPAGAQRPAEGAAARLVALLPSPAKAAWLKHMAEGRVAVLAFTHAGMPAREAAAAAARDAAGRMEGRAGLVLVDTQDVAEKRFVAQMKVKPDATDPVVIVMNAKAQVLGRLEGEAVTAEGVLKAASAKAPCCSDPGCTSCGS